MGTHIVANIFFSFQVKSARIAVFRYREVVSLQYLDSIFILSVSVVQAAMQFCRRMEKSRKTHVLVVQCVHSAHMNSSRSVQLALILQMGLT